MPALETKVDLQLVLAVGTLVGTVCVATGVLKEQLKNAVKALQEHRDEDQKTHKELREDMADLGRVLNDAITAERKERELSVEGARKIAHEHANRAEQVLRESTLRNDRNIAEVANQTKDAINALGREVSEIRGLLSGQGIAPPPKSPCGTPGPH